MLTPPTQRARVIARAAPGDWAALCARAAAGGEVLKDHARGTVWRAGVMGRECVLKCGALDTLRRRTQSLLRLSPAWRHWRGARWLRARGFLTGEPLAIVGGRTGGRPCECLLLEHVPGSSVLEHLARRDLTPRAEQRVAEALGALASRLAREGRYNRDAKPSNLIVTGVRDAGADIAVIDCADLRRCRADDERAIARMLASAVIEPIGCGRPPRLALRMRTVRAAAGADGRGDTRARARRLWERVEGVVREHGDPTPADDPLR